jgi:hypothetical protein
MDRRFPFALALIAACGRAPSPVPTPVAGACVVAESHGPAPDTITIAAPGAIDPAAAPLARSAAERILFRHLYEPLIDVGCDGAVRAGLARAWRPSDGGRTWVFTLRAGAHFWDGVPVTAADVVAAWRSQDTAAVLAPWAGTIRNAVSAVDDTTLIVRLDTAYADVPRALADPGLAIAKRVPGLAAPLGTAPYWLDAAARTPTAAPLPGQLGPVLVFRAVDPRDALDGGADALITDDPGAIAYAGERTDLKSIPLPWDRTYTLVRERRGGPAPDGAALAHDAVRVEARAGGLPDWWGEAARCDKAPSSQESGAPPDAPIAYRRDDPVARGLAERIVAITSDRDRAVGFGAAEFAALLRAGGASGVVLALPRTALDPCLALRRLRALAGTADVLPLVDVRRRLIVRGATSGVYVDWDGVPRWR